MALSISLTAASLTAVVVAWTMIKLFNIGKRDSNLPPGPPTLPLLGNIASFPSEHIYLKLTEWSRVWGECYSLKLGPGTVIVLSSTEAVREVMDKRNATTADRPPSYVADIITEGHHIGVVRYNENWKLLRRAFHEVLTPTACAKHLPIQIAESTQLLHDILKRPENFYTDIRRYTTSVVMSIMFGNRSPQYSSPLVRAFFKMSMEWVKILEPGATPPVDLLPFLKYIPERFAPWKAKMRQIRDLQQSLYYGLLDSAEARSKRGESNGCFIETVQSRSKEWGLKRELVAYIGGVAVEAGSDTTASIFQSIILLMTAFPEVQKKAQEELDRVVGSDRLPTLEDLENLPYVDALLKEVHRFRPAAPLAMPHAATADEHYKGWLIPKGSMLFVNTWGIFHDPDLFDEPDQFKPERFLTHPLGLKKGVDGKSLRNLPTLPFGCGRRICPGMVLAQTSLAINTLNLLWAFNYTPAKNADGSIIEPNLWDYNPGVLTSPNEFKATIVPRSPRHAEVIEQSYLDATPFFLPFEQDLCPEDREFVAHSRKKHV